MTSRRTRDRMIQRLLEQGIQHPEVLKVMANTPRHWFLDEALSHRAYEDTALPIGLGQTLSQPYIVARMTELLLESHVGLQRILEIGTGSGYQTAVLAQLMPRVWTLERIRALQNKARQRLSQLKLHNVQYRHADGNLGWKEYAPYDGIILTAAPRDVPEDLLKQLAPDGVLVLPLGSEAAQNLTVIKREGDTEQFRKRTVEAVRFVPMLPGTTL